MNVTNDPNLTSWIDSRQHRLAVIFPSRTFHSDSSPSPAMIVHESVSPSVTWSWIAERSVVAACSTTHV